MLAKSTSGNMPTRGARVRLVPAVAALVFAGCAGPASVRGVVIPPSGTSGTEGRGSGLDRAVVFAVPTRDEDPLPPLRRATIRQTGHGFEPHTLMVSVNTEIEFQNRDSIYHNAFSPSPAMTFDVGRYGPGQRRSVLFDRVGVIRVFCELHPKSSTTVVVLPPKHIARPRSDGSFTLSGLTPGTYTLMVWHPDFGETHTTLHIPRSGGIRSTLAF